MENPYKITRNPKPPKTPTRLRKQNQKKKTKKQTPPKTKLEPSQARKKTLRK